MYLHLDPEFYPFHEEPSIEFDAFFFNGGEPHIKIKTDLSDVEKVLITHRIKTFNDLGIFLVTVDAVRRTGVRDITAFIPYFPAARQDRVMVPGEPLTVKVYADLINHCNLKEITIYDPHSDVTSALLQNCTTVNNHRFIKKVVAGLRSDLLLVSPDGGALKKIHKLAAYLKDYAVIECSKSRDVRTGALTGFRVYENDLQGRDCLIVDDICDGGGTFIGLAEELRRKNAGRLYLAVSHGIFSKGLTKLAEVFDEIFTTDAFSTLPKGTSVTQIALKQGELF